MKINVSEIRRDYPFGEKNQLLEKDADTNPFRQFERWFASAVKIDNLEANAMYLATSTKSGKPSVRTVLLKDFDENGFVFYTNYLSRKANEIAENPYASLLFYWKELGRQVRIEGKLDKVSREESEEYFRSRPFESRIAALSSVQSAEISGRNVIEEKYEHYIRQYDGADVPLPDYWGGYRLIPDSIEFWQGRLNRMHDRLLYTLIEGEWKITRLSP